MKNLVLFTMLMLSTLGWSQTAEYYFDQGMNKSNAGDAIGSIADFSKAIKLKPTFAEAYLNRGIGKFAQNDLTSALADVNKALEINPEMIYAFTTRANINYKLKDYKATIKDCTTSITTNSNDYISYNLRALSYVHIGDKINACADFSKAIQLGSQSAVKNKQTFCK